MNYRKRKFNRRLSFILTLAMIIGMMPGVSAKALPGNTLLVAMSGTQFSDKWTKDTTNTEKAVILRNDSAYVTNVPTATGTVSGIRIVPADYGTTGSATFVQPLRVDQDFSIAFRVYLGEHGGSGSNTGAFGEGFSFILSKNLAQNEGGLGYGADSNSIAIEYDTMYDSVKNDPSGFGGDNTKPHIAIDTNGSTTHTSQNDPVVATWDNDEVDYVYFWIDYDKDAKNLYVYANSENSATGAVSLTKYFENALSGVLNSNECYLRIAAANYDCYQDVILTDIYVAENTHAYFGRGINIGYTGYTSLSGNPYCVQYDINCTDSSSVLPSAVYKTYGSTVTLASEPTRPYYYFDGWSYSSTTAAAGDTVTITGNTTFTAVWQPKTAPVVTAPVRNYTTGYTGLKYSGSNQALITAGNTAHGTIEYALGTSSTTAPTTGWSTAIPTGSAAQTYHVWYRVTGDRTHLDQAATLVSPEPWIGYELKFEQDTANEAQGTLPTPALYPSGGTYTFPSGIAGGLLGLTQIDNKYISCWEDLTSPSIYQDSRWWGATPVSSDPITVTMNQNRLLKPIWTAKDSALISAPIANSWTYDGTYKPLVTTTDSVLNWGSAHTTMEYQVTAANVTPASTAWSTTTPDTVKDAGTYRLWYRATGNYRYSEVEGHVEVVVSPLTVTMTAPTAVETLNFNTQPLTIGNVGTVSSSDIQMLYAVNSSASEPTSGWTTTIPTRTNAGDFRIWYKLAVKEGKIAGNYTLPTYESNTNFVSGSIAKANITFTTPTPKLNLVFNTNSQALINTGSATFGTTNVGTINYIVTSTNVNSLPGTDAGWTTTNYYGEDAGTYRVWYKLDLTAAEALNYNAVDSGHIDVEIAQAIVAVTTPTVVNRTYTGNDQALISSTNPGSATQNCVIKYAVSDSAPEDSAYSAELPTGKNAGTYKIWFKAFTPQGESASNYIVPAAASVSVSIAKATPAVTAAPGVKTGLKFNTQNQELITGGQASGGTFWYAVLDGADQAATSLTSESWRETVPSKLNAGYYTVFAKIVGDSNHSDINYSLGTVQIAKINPTVTAPTAISVTYNGQSHILLNTYGSTTGGTMMYKLGSETSYGDGDWTDNPATLTKIDSGVYFVWYYSEGNTNYNSTTPQKVTAYINMVSAQIGGDGAIYSLPTANSRDYDTYSRALVVTPAVTPSGYHIEYIVTNSGTTQPSTTADGWSTSVPTATNVGTYHVWCRYIGANSNYTSYGPYVINTIISPVDPTYTAYSSIQQYYDNNDHPLLTGGSTSHGTFRYKVGIDGTESTTVPERKDAGTYTVYYRVIGDANHNNTDWVTTENPSYINKVNSSCSSAPTAKTLTYNNDDQALVNAGTASGGTMLYKLGTSTTAGDGAYSINIPTGKNAGTYYVWYKVGGDGNHNDTGNLGPVAVTIQKAASTVTAPVGATAYFNGGPHGLLATPATSSHGTVKYAVTATTVTTAPDKNDFGTEVPTGTNVGIYRVWYMVAGDNNHYDNYGNSNYVDAEIYPIAPGLGGGVGAISPVLHDDKTYDGVAINLVTTLGYTSQGTIYYTVSSTTPTVSGSAWYVDSPTGKNAGEYKVWYYIDGTGNYDVTTTPAFFGTVTIAKATPSYEAPVGLEHDWTGQPKDLITAGSVASNATTGSQGTMKYAVGNTQPASDAFSADVPQESDAGTYTVWYMVQGNDNYESVAASSTRTVTAKINGINPTCNTAPTANTLTYNTEAQILTTNGSATGGTIKFTTTASDAAPTAGASWSETVPTGTNHGTYYVWYKVFGDSNHNDTDPALVTVNIAKATPIVTPPANIALQTYQGTPLELLTGGHTASGSMYFAVGNNEPAWGTNAWSTSIPKETEVGDYYTWYYVTESDNYLSAGPTAVSGYARINEAPAGITVPHGKNLTFNNEDQELVTAGSATGGTMLYAVSESNQAAPENGWDDDVPERKNAGTYYIWYYVDGDGNHDDTEKSFVTTTIAKHAAVYTAPQGRRLIYDGTVFDLVIAGSVDGADDADMLYSIGTATESANLWTATVPYSDAIGGCYIWYKSPETTNYLEAVGKVYTTINSGAEITYYGNGAESGSAPAMDTVPAGYDYTISGNTGNLSKYGKVFAGWNTKPDCSGDVYLAGAGIVPTGDLSLYAVWVDSLKAQALADPYGLNLNYKGEYQNLVVAGITSGGQLIYALGDSYETMPSTGWSPSIPRGIAEGTYWIWYYVKGDAYHEDSAPSRLRSTIGSGSTVISGGGSQGGGSQGGGSYNPPESTATPTPQATPTPYGFGNSTYTPAPVYTATPTPRPVASVVTAPSGKDLIYNGSLQVLATAGSAFNGSMWYALGDSSSAPVLGWNSSVPSASEIGTYYIWYWVVGDDGYDNTAKSYVVSNITGLRPTATPTNTATPTPAVTATPTPIVKIPSFVVKAPNGKTLPYTGAAQTLAGSGSAGGGVMVYALGNDGSTAPASGWSESVPSGTDAGTYYIWYKVIADDKHIDNTPDYVISTISRTTQEAPVEYYEEVQVTDGVVKDITGTEEAPAETNPLSASIDNNNELETLLSVQADEKAIGVNVWLEVTDVTDIIPEEEKQAIEEGASDDYTVAVYVDVSLFKKIGTEDEKKIHETDGKVKISILIPEELREEGREYQMIRYHNGETTVLEGIYDPETFMFTFETDQFSSYAIAYKEDNGISVKPSKTSESRALDLWLSFMMAAMGGLTILGYFYKKREEER